MSANHPEKVPEAIEACRELLDSYAKCINNMLKCQREPFVFLQLLTGKKFVFMLPEKNHQKALVTLSISWFNNCFVFQLW